MAYVDREYAWKIFEPSILKEKRLFYEYLNEADSQAKKEPLLASKYYVEAKKKGDIFVAVLDYGRLINEEKERQYKDDRNNVASIPKKQKDIKESAVIFIVVNNDSNNIVSANLEKLLSDSGFIISKQKEKALYIVEVEINQNITIEDAGTDVESFVSLPDLNINISNISSGRSIFSSAGKTTKKSIAYSRENVLKKALPLLNEEIIYSFVQGRNAMIDGY